VRALGIDMPAVAGRLRETLASSDATFSSLAARFDMSQPHVAELFEAARRIADAAIAPGGPAQACASANATESCVRELLASFGKLAFRRPLTSEELATFEGFFQEQRRLSDVATSLSSVLRAMFMSPSFLYRSELGEGDAAGAVRMTQDEIASAIAYYVTDGPPDAELSSAAERGELATPEQRAAHARRLLGESVLGAGVLRFFGEYFRTESVGNVSARDALLYPDFDSGVARAYGAETQAFFSEVMLRDGARLSTFLTAPYVMVTSRTAPFYGIEGVTSETPMRYLAPAGQRAGILTQPSWLTRFAHDKEGNPVGRGRFVRERLLCEPVPPPPPTVNAALPPPDDTRTQRERLEVHKTDPACAGCHVLLDPIGFAFGNYDAVGGYRSQELGRPIDSSGSFQDAQGNNYSFQDAPELAAQLASSPAVDACFSRQVFLFAQGLAQDDASSCAFAALRERVAAAGESTLDRIVAMLSADEFYMRSQEAQ
jgi:hypothetical protein